MTSQIDPTVPVAGNPTTASVRANFLTAQGEITALQNKTNAAPFLPLAGGAMTGPMYLANDPTDPRMPATKAYVDAGGGGGGGGIPEAPADDTLYGRLNGAWSQAAALADITAAIAALPAATETVSGLIQIATTAEVTAGTDDTAAVTALKLAAKLATATASYLPLVGGTLTGNLTIAPTPAASSPTLILNKPDANGANLIAGQQAGALLWSIALGGSTGANNFVIHRQTGVAAGDALTIEQANPFINFAGFVSIGPQSNNTPQMPMIAGPSANPPAAQDGFVLAARRTIAPASSGAYYDGAIIVLHGPFASGNPGGVDIVVGTQAAGYGGAVTINSSGAVTLPSSLFVQGTGGLTVTNNAQVNGSMVVAGTLTVQGGGGLSVTNTVNGAGFNFTGGGSVGQGLTVNPSGGGTAIQANGNVSVTGNISGANTLNITNAGTFGSVNAGALSGTTVSITGGGGWYYYGTGSLIALHSNAAGADEFYWNTSQQFYPATNNGAWCGIGGQAWYTVEAYNFGNASDRSEKTDFVALPDCLALVEAISPSRYRWREGADTERTHWGFVAQDVETAFGEAGHEFGGHRVDPTTGLQSLAYNELTAVLWKATQELAARLDALEGSSRSRRK
jgi:hypothetical protein